MVSNRSDPVLMVVGIILIIAIFAGIAASVAIPAKLTQKVVKCTSSGKTTLDSPCCTDQDTFTSGCALAKVGECQKECIKVQKRCSRAGYTSCRNNIS
ncbi:MAG: hypothetical protein CVV33_02400 [Methanomicrobiales archaeon HGW-Methanomicrobiales-4]|nr:MAG: hypothetical protein CVV33_02400 [Methanomicrobiales archaeon HGW-Methanomicrobiales-4]